MGVTVTRALNRHRVAVRTYSGRSMHLLAQDLEQSLADTKAEAAVFARRLADAQVQLEGLGKEKAQLETHVAGASRCVFVST